MPQGHQHTKGSDAGHHQRQVEATEIVPTHQSGARRRAVAMREALLARFGEPPFTRAVVAVIGWIDLPHRLLAGPFLVGVCDEARQPRDQEHGVAEIVGKAQIGTNRGNGTVDIDRQRAELVLTAFENVFGRAQQVDVLTFELELERHLEEARRPRIAGVKPVPEARRPLTLAHTVVDQFAGPPPARTAPPGPS